MVMFSYGSIHPYFQYQGDDGEFEKKQIKAKLRCGRERHTIIAPSLNAGM